jgi:hypothetical protein
VEACERVGWKKPSRIQEEAIPVALQVARPILLRCVELELYPITIFMSIFYFFVVMYSLTAYRTYNI